MLSIGLHFGAVHEKIDILNERLEAAGGDKVIDDVPQGSKASVAIKKCAYLFQMRQNSEYPRVRAEGKMEVDK